MQHGTFHVSVTPVRKIIQSQWHQQMCLAQRGLAGIGFAFHSSRQGKLSLDLACHHFFQNCWNATGLAGRLRRWEQRQRLRFAVTNKLPVKTEHMGGYSSLWGQGWGERLMTNAARGRLSTGTAGTEATSTFSKSGKHNLWWTMSPLSRSRGWNLPLQQQNITCLHFGVPDTLFCRTEHPSHWQEWSASKWWGKGLETAFLHKPPRAEKPYSG